MIKYSVVKVQDGNPIEVMPGTFDLEQARKDLEDFKKMYPNNTYVLFKSLETYH